MNNLKKSGYDEDSVRKCASIISKKKNSLEIIDAVSYRTIEVEADDDILSQAEINDQVIYTLLGKTAKIVELRK